MYHWLRNVDLHNSIWMDRQIFFAVIFIIDPLAINVVSTNHSLHPIIILLIPQYSASSLLTCHLFWNCRFFHVKLDACPILNLSKHLCSVFTAHSCFRPSRSYLKHSPEVILQRPPPPPPQHAYSCKLTTVICTLYIRPWEGWPPYQSTPFSCTILELFLPFPDIYHPLHLAYAVAYLGGHWAMAPFGKKNFFWYRKNIEHTLAPPLCRH